MLRQDEAATKCRLFWYCIDVGAWKGYFLKDLRRLNRALTRERFGPIIVGNRATLGGGSVEEESTGVSVRIKKCKYRVRENFGLPRVVLQGVVLQSEVVGACQPGFP